MKNAKLKRKYNKDEMKEKRRVYSLSMTCHVLRKSKRSNRTQSKAVQGKQKKQIKPSEHRRTNKRSKQSLVLFFLGRWHLGVCPINKQCHPNEAATVHQVLSNEAKTNLLNLDTPNKTSNES